jgi:Ni,Fe-hydrogenase III large subunit
MTTFLSTMFGGGLRANTPEEQRNQLIRMQRELADDMKRMIDIEVRNV